MITTNGSPATLPPGLLTLFGDEKRADGGR